MLAILYIALIIGFGTSLVMLCINTDDLYNSISGEYSKKVLKSLFIIPTGTIVGLLTINLTNYYLIYLINSLFPKIINYSYIVGFSLTFIIYTFLTYLILKKIKTVENNKITKKKKLFYIITIIFFIVIASFLMFYTYRINNGILLVGPTTISDMSPHTAMTSSFGIGGNIPTNYMHFANDGIRYHFLFYFFTGSLKYLGMPIDIAINIPSIMVMVCAFTLIGLIANLLCKKKIAFLIPTILILFRSSLNFLFLIIECITGNVSFFNNVVSMNSWYKVTPFDDWGIWAINVYPNQRHLMLGISIILILVLLFIPLVKQLFNNLKNYHGLSKFKYFLLNKKNWLINNNDKFIIIPIIIVACMPYFHGSALIGSLLVLFGMAIVSEKRLSYLIVAAVALVSSIIQTKLFSDGTDNVINFVFRPGFVVEDKSLFGILKYLFIITGLLIIIAGIYVAIKQKKEKYLLPLAFAFSLPLVFAFLFQITLEMLANHKFIQFTIILLDIFAACFLAELFTKKNKFFLNIIIGTFISVILTATGIIEWFSYINMNKNPGFIDTKSEMITWIKKNTKMDDTFLTPWWSMHEFFLTGRQSYMGWPYYAWSAGHNTYKREASYEQLLLAMNDNINKFIAYCKHNKIKYLVDSPDFDIYEFKTKNGYYHQKYLQDNLELIVEFPNENIKIYQIYN